MKRSLTLLLLALLPVASTTRADEVVKVDDSIPAYQQVSGISGSLNSIGSDTLNNLMTLWAESFKAKYPNINIQIEGKGSSTAPVALIEGTAQLGPMSREMKSEEIDGFEAKFGYKPLEVKVAIDALAVYVHKDNPIEGLTLKQVDSIFSSTYKAGGTAIRTWGQAGLSGEWKDKEISKYGRNSASGTYGFFKDEALLKGDYDASVKEQPGSSAVVQGVASDLAGIGYSGIGYKTSGVKAISLGTEEGALFAPTYDNCLNGDFPLSRFLYIYVNKNPEKPLDPLTLEFLKFVLSKEGQEVVVKDGYFPMPAEIVSEVSAEISK
ncbi:MAG: phosphate ABC transporter substrate-binding protein [Verrucomicrobiae bacterium]|nr:phosphate ABC transporter substrate-binding protein [Verrucomicrobiae bacterium]